MTSEQWYGIFLVIAVLAITYLTRGRRKESVVSVQDNTSEDIEAMITLIDGLPTSIQGAIADGTVMLEFFWQEVCRDEDDWPTIKPKIIIKPVDKRTFSVIDGGKS